MFPRTAVDHHISGVCKTREQLHIVTFLTDLEHRPLQVIDECSTISKLHQYGL